jgi:hypothetical protein
VGWWATASQSPSPVPAPAPAQLQRFPLPQYCDSVGTLPYPHHRRGVSVPEVPAVLKRLLLTLNNVQRSLPDPGPCSSSVVQQKTLVIGSQRSE